MGQLTPPTAPTCADGGLATWLQRSGLPPMTPVNAWIAERPDDVRAAHAAFVDAGSTLIVAGTFRAVASVDPTWEAVALEAVRLARAAAPPGGAVWGSIGPADAPWARLDSAGRRAAIAERVALARALAPVTDGLLCETIPSVDEALALLDAIGAAVPDRPIAVSLCPAPDGAVLDGTAPDVAIDRLRAAGADAVGFNCGTGPAGVARAVARSGRSGLWARPAGDPVDPSALARALAPLADRCAVVGGCCGAGPDAIRALLAALGGAR